jgi:hypothetical protein
MTNLNENTPVPTHARGALRAFIRGQAGFDAWIARRGVASRDVKNADLIAYALENNLENEVLAILNSQTFVQAHETVQQDAFIAGPASHGMAGQASETDMTDVQTILAPVEPFLSPLVKSELEKALAPLIAAANKPARTIEVVREVEKIVNLAPLSPGATPYAQPQHKIEIGKLFGFRGNNAKSPVTIWESHGAAPSIDPLYVVDAPNMAMMGTAIERGSNVWLGGPSGSGKVPCPNSSRPIRADHA